MQATNTTKNLSGTNRDVVIADLQKLTSDLVAQSATAETNSQYVLQSDFNALLDRIEKFNQTMPSNHKI